MVQFDQWLESLDQRRTVLLEVDYLNKGTSGSLYFANRPFVSSASDSPASTPYDDVILSGLTHGRSIGSGTAGALSLTVGSVSLAASPEVVEASAFEFAGKEVRVYLGDQRWKRDDFRLVSVLTAESLEPADRDSYVLNFRTERLDLADPVSSGTVAEGPNAGKQLPICFGECFNVHPLQLDEAGLKWALSDGPISSVSAVRVGGSTASPSIDLTSGVLTFSSKPSGTVTADVLGSATDAKSILSLLLGRRAVPLEAPEALDGIPTYPIGLYSRNGLSYRQAFDAILASFGGFWGFSRLGGFRTGIIPRPQGGAASLLTADDILLNGVKFSRRVRPAYEMALQYRKNYTPQDVPGFEEASSEALAPNEGLQAAYPDAERKEAETLIVNEAHAQSEADRRASFYSSPLRVFNVEAFALPFSYQVGQEVRLVYPHLGMEQGADAVVLSITDDPLRGSTSIGLLLNG